MKRLLIVWNGSSSSAEFINQCSESRLAIRDTFSRKHLKRVELADEDELAVLSHVFATTVDGDDGGPHLLGRGNAYDLVDVRPRQPTENKLTRLSILFHDCIMFWPPVRPLDDVLRDLFITKIYDFPALKVLGFDVRGMYT